MQMEGLNSIQETVCLNRLRGQIVFKMSNWAFLEAFIYRQSCYDNYKYFFSIHQRRFPKGFYSIVIY